MKDADLQNQIDYVLAMAIRKCDSLTDAEDLTQETMLAALTFLDNGGEIDDLKAWLNTVLNRKFCDMLRRKYRMATVTIGEGMEFATEEDLIDNMICHEEKEAVRREVAYLAKSYRDSISKYYFYNKSVKEIAQELCLPEGTVKSRLDFGRKQLKKGFRTMKTYAENSYMPQQLAVRNSGRMGWNEEPMSLTEEDLLAQNLLILAYHKPLTITEVSKAIGVSAAYVEPIIHKLVNGELMKRMGDGKVYTDFIIYHAEDYVKHIKEQEAFALRYADCYCKPLQEAIKALKDTEFYSLRLERFMMLCIGSDGLYRSLEGVRKPQIFPERPNGGAWVAFGTIWPQNYRIPLEKQGKEEYSMSGRRCISLDMYLGTNKLKLYNYETALYPYPKHTDYGFSCVQDVEFNMLKLFYLIKHRIAPETVDCNTRIVKAIPLLEKRGFLTTENGTPELLIPCLNHTQAASFWNICDKATSDFAKHIADPLSEYLKTHRMTIPAHLKSVPDQKLSMPYEPNCMMFVFEAIRRGVHPRDLGYPCPETLAVFD